ncbi:hypothetical protein Cgig2_007708 [Carnegiea gigantea]|uniref:Disease resistance protein n=1 Tax=Carnegiea gigantea TaxID=171969 RepID=A0A9Q1K8R6_9CARY|nr:hypothetical protein Cgig2_007708 [Carnegiea gigantea]
MLRYSAAAHPRCGPFKFGIGEDKEDDGMPWHCLRHCLRSLELSELPKLVNLPNGMRYLTALHSLHIEACGELESVPEWMPELTSLKQLIILDCSDGQSSPVFSRHLSVRPSEQSPIVRLLREVSSPIGFGSDSSAVHFQMVVPPRAVTKLKLNKIWKKGCQSHLPLPNSAFSYRNSSPTSILSHYNVAAGLLTITIAHLSPFYVTLAPYVSSFLDVFLGILSIFKDLNIQTAF